MPNTLPTELHDQKYISLATFRKNGIAVHTPVWFAEENEKLYVMTRDDSGKYKRIRNNPVVKVAPSTIRGKVRATNFPPAHASFPRRTGLMPAISSAPNIGSRAFRSCGAKTTSTWRFRSDLHDSAHNLACTDHKWIVRSIIYAGSLRLLPSKVY